MNITDAQYKKNPDGNVNSIMATIDGTVWSIPLEPDNTFYEEIQKQVKEGTLTIKDAE